MTRDNVSTRHGALHRAAADIYHPLNPVGIYGYTRQRQQFVQMLNRVGESLQGARILDLGSGTGEWTRFFAELKGTTDGIIGIEYNAAPIAYARSLSPIQYIQGDMADLSTFGDGSFDFATAFVSLMFLPDMQAVQDVVRQVRRALTPNGLLFISELNEQHQSERPYSGYRYKELRYAVESCGFELIQGKGIFKNFLGWRKLSSYYRVGFASMDVMPFLERVIPGRAAYYYQLYRKAP